MSNSNFTSNLIPRCLKRAAAADYCGFSVGHFNKLISMGLMPNATDMLGVLLWFREELDEALEQFRGPKSSPSCDELFQ